ncbi:MAG: glycosyltransferase [bacterium]
MKLNIITVTYGERFKFLKQVLDATVSDANVDKIILVDNASLNKKEIDQYIAQVNINQQKIVLVRHTDNLGSAGGFKSGILEARKHICDYVLLLDDDNVPEKGWGEAVDSLESIFREKMNNLVFSMDRGAQPEFFTTKEFYSTKDDLFKLSISNFNELANFVLRGRKSQDMESKNGKYIPIKRIDPCGYGGSLIPYKILKECNLPNEKLFVYFDDTLFFGEMILNQNINIYKIDYPKIKNVDISFEDENIYKTFYSVESSNLKVYYWIRNRLIIAIKYSEQSNFSIKIIGFIWILYIILLGITKSKSIKIFLSKTAIILKAYKAGICLDFSHFQNKYDK